MEQRKHHDLIEKVNFSSRRRVEGKGTDEVYAKDTRDPTQKYCKL